MKREDIIRMAREAGFHAWYTQPEEHPDHVAIIERFAALVIAAERNSWPAEMEAMERQVNILTDALAQAKAEEREACAQVVQGLWYIDGQFTADEFATAIRARSNT